MGSGSHERRPLRVHFVAPPSLEQLRQLRACIPALRDIPVARLRERLGAASVFVLGAVDGDEQSRLAQLERAGMRPELVDDADYTADYICNLVPEPPAEWHPSREKLELVVRPSFAPEFVMRFWSESGETFLQLASLNLSIWVRHFNRASWLLEGLDSENESASEEATSDVVKVPACPSLFDDAYALTETPPALDETCVVVDGTTVDVRVVQECVSAQCSLHLPASNRDAAAFMRNVRRLACTALEGATLRNSLRDLLADG